MTTSELLRRIPIPRHKLYYLEQKGYISPKKNQVGEKEFRDYSERDAEKVRLIWRFVQEGFRYRVAHEKALESIVSRTKTGNARA